MSSSFFSRATFDLLASIVLNASILLLVLVLGTPRFGTNDDTSMMLQVAGVSSVSAPTEYLLYSHVWIGSALKVLYRALPSIPWYACYIAGALFAAHIALLYAALRRWGLRRSLLPFGLYTLLIGSQFILRLQFTVAACMVSAAGQALIFCDSPGCASQRASRWRPVAECTAGVVLLLFGGMIRWDSLLLAIVLLLPVMAADAALNVRRAAVGRVGVCLAALLLAWGLMQYDRERVRRSEGTGGYREFNDLKSRFVDDRMLDPARPAEIAPALARAGWSLNDYDMLLYLAFADTNVFNADSFRAALRGVARRKPVPTAVVAREMRKVLQSPWVWNACLAAFFTALWVRSRRGWQSLGLVLATILALCAYLVWFRKPPPDRVYWPMFALAAWVPLLTGGTCRAGVREGRSRVLLLLVIAAALVVRGRWALASYVWQSRENRQEQQWLRDTLVRMNPNAGQLYVTWGASFPWVRLDPFGSLEALRPLQVSALGTEQATSAGRAVLRRHGIQDLFAEMPRRSDVFLVVYDKNMLELYRTYVREHHGFEIESETVFSAGYFDVLRLCEVDRARTGGARLQARERE